MKKLTEFHVGDNSALSREVCGVILPNCRERRVLSARPVSSLPLPGSGVCELYMLEKTCRITTYFWTDTYLTADSRFCGYIDVAAPDNTLPSRGRPSELCAWLGYSKIDLYVLITVTSFEGPLCNDSYISAVQPSS